MRSLQSIYILDLTRLLPGAIATMLLADMGAQVVKVEDRQAGDYARWTPPFIEGQGAFFRASNRNKQSLALDLKQPAGQAVLHRLVQRADVLIEGFRPGVTARLGADYATLSAINPRLIYASLSGWGQTGPYADLSGHNLNYEALSGLQGSTRTPQPLGGQIADVGGAYAAVAGICAALFARTQTGRGQVVDIALFEAAMPFSMYQWVESVAGGTTGGTGSLTGGMAFYDVYTSSDGEPMALAAIEPKFWQNFCAAVQRPDWLPLHTDLSQQDALRAQLVALFATRSAAEWESILGQADCCWSRITPPARFAEDPQVQARGMAGIEADGTPYLRSPIHLSESAPPPLAPAPEQGADSAAILSAAGYSAEDIAALLAQGVVGK